MGRDFYAEVFYGLIFTLEEAVAMKGVAKTQDLQKWMDDVGTELVRDFLHDTMDNTYKKLKTISLNNSSIPWIEEEFYVFITESVVKTKESWVKKIDILDDFELKKEFWNRQIKKFCEEHSIPYKEPAWHLQLASF